MTDKTTEQKTYFVVTANVVPGPLMDEHTMRKGIEEGIDIAKRECMLTKLEDEETDIRSITVAAGSSPVDAVMAVLGRSIEDTPESRTSLRMALQKVLREHAPGRLQILAPVEREALISGIVALRKDWQRSGQDDWISDVARNGYDGWEAQTDMDLLGSALISSCVLAELNGQQLVTALTMLTRDNVVQAILAAHSRNEIDELIESVTRATEMMQDRTVSDQAYDLAEEIVQKLEEQEDAPAAEAPGM